MINLYETRQHSGAIEANEVRATQVRGTREAVKIINALIAGENLSGKVKVVTSEEEVARISDRDASKLETIFVFAGQQNDIDSDQSALVAIRRNPDFSNKKIVLIANFQLNPQLEQMYKALGADEVGQYSDMGPNEFTGYAVNPLQTATAA